ncbi:hypothetical protein KY285_036974 [Solanum tuberosum]|nr:hypothetical protein KY285_036974 [Solanum tuberosum]
MLINLRAKSKLGFVLGTDAATVWADIKERFDKVDGSRTYQLHREICTIHQGLNDVYGYARSQLLMMNPLPNVSKAYALIVSDESQRHTSEMHT